LIAGLDRPTGLLEIKASKISRQLTHEGNIVVSPMHRPPSPPTRYPSYWFLLEAELTPGPECSQNG